VQIAQNTKGKIIFLSQVPYFILQTLSRHLLFVAVE
jgi:hypothetical protein